MVVLLALACFAGGLLAISTLLRQLSWRRQIRFRAEPIPSGWLAIVDRCVPLARGLAADERERLLRLAQVFLAEKHVEGCGGLVVTEEMRVTIAAEACLLLLHLEGPCYPTLRTVLIYPHAFVPKLARAPQTGEIVMPTGQPNGQSMRSGVVVLASTEVVNGTASEPGG